MPGLAVLPFYLAYRALVRAKIARLRAAQLGAGAREAAPRSRSRADTLRLARSYAEPPRPALIVTCGLSGAARRRYRRRCWRRSARCASAATSSASDCTGSRRSSDAMRRIAQRLYAPAATEATYDRLRALARDILGAGRIAIVDATFLRHAQRESFRALAAELGGSVRDPRIRSERGDAARAHHPTSGRGRRCLGRRSRGARAPDRDARAADGRRERVRHRVRRRSAARSGARRRPRGPSSRLGSPRYARVSPVHRGGDSAFVRCIDAGQGACPICAH